jgi:hypothetical protein
MSKALTEVIERASIDAGFRAQLQSDPDAALAGYELTAEEHAALLHGGTVRHESLALDARVTKQAGNPGPGPIEIPAPIMGPFL